MAKIKVISGFNTDVEFDGVVYHVQTEDKGASARKIISLVYDRGTILASKRTPYDKISGGSPTEDALAEHLQRQHKLICAAVKAGRINELIKMTRDARKDQPDQHPEVQPTPSSPSAPPTSIPIGKVETVRVVSVRPNEPIANEPATPAAPPTPRATPMMIEIADDDPFFDAPLFEDVQIIDEEIEVLPAEAVAVVSELSGKERPSNSKLSVELLGDTKFKGGDRITAAIMVCRGTSRKVVPDAQIMIKALGSSFRPVIFHANSDANGLARVHLQIPHFQAGRAALLIRAMSEGEEVELRRVVTPG